MHYTMERLINGDATVGNSFAAAVRLWDEICESDDFGTVPALATRLSGAQTVFEAECGGRWPGQEVFAWVGIARFYTTAEGFTDDDLPLARRVATAFAASQCSIEVKKYARDAAAAYDLDAEQ